MDIISSSSAVYRSKLTDAATAAALIPKQGTLAFGMGPANPPQLISALAERIQAKEIDNLHIHYQIAREPAAPLFRLDFLDRIHLHPNFMSELDRNLIKLAS